MALEPRSPLILLVRDPPQLLPHLRHGRESTRAPDVEVQARRYPVSISNVQVSAVGEEPAQRVARLAHGRAVFRVPDHREFVRGRAAVAVAAAHITAGIVENL